MPSVRTTEHIYSVDIYPVDAMPGGGERWAARVTGVRKVIDGAALHLAQQAEHYGATAGAALDAGS